MNARTRSTPQQRLHHIQVWQDSGLSKIAYSRLHNLNIKTSGFWTRQAASSPASAAVFIPARMTRPGPVPSVPVPVTAILTLPSGCTVTAAPAALADMIRELNLC